MRKVAVSALSVVVCALVTSSAQAQDGEGEWCAVLGSFPYDGFARAEALAAKAKAEGFASAAVYDTRDIGTFAWGELAVIAEATADRAAAKEVMKKLKKAKLKAFAKPCTRADLAGKAIVKADAIRPLPTLGKTPPKIDPKALPEGCFAWSTKTRSAACFTGSESIQEGGVVNLEVPGAPSGGFEVSKWEGQTLDDAPVALSPKQQKALNKLLKDGGYVAIDMIEGRETTANGQLHWAAPRFSVHFTRLSERVDDSTGNSWYAHNDAIKVRCGGAKAAWVDAITGKTHADEPTLTVYAVPQTPFAILLVSYRWGIEGDFGTSTHAAVVNMETCEKR